MNLRSRPLPPAWLALLHAGLVALPACVVVDDDGAAPPVVRPDALARLDDASVVQCPAGGAVVVTGIDDDGDGVLDDAEVDQRTPVCAGANGADGADGTNGAAGADGTDGAAAAPFVFRTRPLPADDARCPGAGSVFESGRDADGDLVLDDGEVDPAATRVLCDAVAGADGDDGDDGPAGTVLAALLVVSRAARPEECATGGTTLEFGHDDDGDGALEDDEGVPRLVVPACRGAVGATGPDGVAGASGATSLLSQRVVDGTTPGQPCAAGGVETTASFDGDGDGVLAPAEVQTIYVCDGLDGVADAPVFVRGDVVVGSLLVLNSLHTFLLARITAVEGDVLIATTAATLAWPSLQRVTGGVDVSSPTLSDAEPLVALPALTSIGGDLEAGRLGALDLPVLTSLGGTLRVDPRLPALSLPALTSVGGDVQLDDTGLTRIERLELPQLITVGGAFTVKNTTKLTTLAVPALTSVGGAFSVQFSALSSLSLPALRATTGLTLAFNESLTALDVQGPLAVGARDGVDVVVENNVSLPCDAAGAVVCAIAPAPLAVEVSLTGNADFFCVAPTGCVQ